MSGNMHELGVKVLREKLHDLDPVCWGPAVNVAIRQYGDAESLEG